MLEADLTGSGDISYEDAQFWGLKEISLKVVAG